MVKPASLDKTESISHKTESTPEAASGEYGLGSFSFPYDNQNDFLSKFLFFGPLVEELGKITRDIAVNAAFLVGGFWNSRASKRHLNRIKVETGQRENAKDGLPLDDLAKFYWPDDPKANEAAENEARKIIMTAERAKQSAASAAGIS
jgi:hypothetical protein